MICSFIPWAGDHSIFPFHPLALEMAGFPVPIVNTTLLFLFFAFLASLVNLYLKRTKKLTKDNAQCVAPLWFFSPLVFALRHHSCRFAEAVLACCAPSLRHMNQTATSARAGFFFSKVSLLPLFLFIPPLPLSPPPQIVLRVHHGCHLLLLVDVAVHVATPVAPAHSSHSS